MTDSGINKTQHFAYEALRMLALTRNYNKWIYETFKDFLAGKNVLEVGCGIGNLSQYFLKSCSRLIGIDNSSFFTQHLKIDHPEIEAYNFDITDDKVTSLSDKKTEVVIAINVLEHIKDDDKALQNMHKLLQPDGRLLLFVPALGWLFGTLDENVGHCRRYGKKDLRDKVERNGFAVDEIFFSNFFGIFGWFINGKIFKRKSFPIMQPILFDKFVPFLSKLEGYFRPGIGMNLIVIARKNERKHCP
ncbi:MAG: class I SAM-dependent methyltransferase [bacterium]